MPSLVEILPYDPQWVMMYNAESEVIKGIFGPEVVTIHHIGSTAVPGLLAKPIIDILVEVQDIKRVDGFNEPMRQLGYEPRGEYGLPRRRYFPKIVNGRRTHNVHIWQKEDPEIERHLAFRDYMMTFPGHAEAYGRLKEHLVVQHGGDKEKYMDGKDGFCKEIERKALEWKRDIDAHALQTDRLRLIPLSPAQLHFSLGRPDQLEAELGYLISREMFAPPVPDAIRVKIKRTTNASLEKLLWETYWLVEVSETRFGAGLLGFKGQPDDIGQVEIGYGIDPQFRSMGYTTEAAGTLIDWALQQPDCLAITAWTDKDNAASARVVQKIGLLMARETADQFYWIRNRKW